MGRKIPAKRHRGVKDPEKQRIKRLAELASKTNAPPKDVDDQEIPQSLQHVIKLKESAKNSHTLKKKRKKNKLITIGQQHPNPDPKARQEKVVPVLQQKPGESGQHFLHRVSKETHAFLKETAFEHKYGVQVERDLETGQIQGLSKRKDNKDDIEVLRTKHKNIGKKKKIANSSTSLTHSEKRKLKKQLKNKKKLEEDEDEFERLQDKVAFGEVVHEPPKLNIKKQIAGGKKGLRNLLLNSLLEAGPKKVTPASKAIDRHRKRKNLPVAERRRLEKQQNEVIAMYRQLKSQRLANTSY